MNLIVKTENSPISKQPILKRMAQFEDLQKQRYNFRNDLWVLLNAITFLQLPIELKP